jgi:hypothetical protein
MQEGQVMDGDHQRVTIPEGCGVLDVQAVDTLA